LISPLLVTGAAETPWHAPVASTSLSKPSRPHLSKTLCPPCKTRGGTCQAASGSMFTMWWVYVLQSQVARVGRQGRPLPGFFYVGCTTDPLRRLRQHNGEIQGGGRYTSKHRPWVPRALYGPYPDQSSALKAERALKHGKRGVERTRWSPADSPWCRGEGPTHPWVQDPKRPMD